MQLSLIEKDLLGELSQDTHELWEWYAFLRSNNPTLSEEEVIRSGRELLAVWIERGWLKAVRSRSDTSPLSGLKLLTVVDALGLRAADPVEGTMVLDLTERASKDIDWLPKKKDYLTVYDYGTGGLWTIIRARSKEEISARYPKLTIFDERPDWMTEDHEAYRIAKKNAFDIDNGEPPAWFKEMK